MTAEIAVMNAMGVALAADSAVSIGSSQKVYNSANKLFALSKSEPVGIMVYGNAHFLSVPWETLIKAFRKSTLKSQKKTNIKEYAALFLDFLKKTPFITLEQEQLLVKFYVEQLLSKIVAYIPQHIENFIRLNGSINQQQSQKEVNKAVIAWCAQQKMGASTNAIGASSKKKLVSLYKKRVQEALTQSFINLNFSQATINQATNKIFDCLGCIDYSLGEVTGIVIAGFGSDDVYPSTFSFAIKGKINGELIVGQEKLESITPLQNASIQPYAQREMVDAFMCGIDPTYRRAIYTNLSDQLNRVISETLPNVGIKVSPTEKAELLRQVGNHMTAMQRANSNIERQYFVRPIIDSVASLPVDELAAMAEALVNLTSFKRRVTLVPESVGGPVDVAVITKGDGFIWIKRKHYFKPELNQHYFSLG